MVRKTRDITCPEIHNSNHKPSCKHCHGSNFATVYIDTTKMVNPKNSCPICGGIGMFGIDDNNKAKQCYYCQGTGLNNRAVA